MAPGPFSDRADRWDATQEVQFPQDQTRSSCEVLGERPPWAVPPISRLGGLGWGLSESHLRSNWLQLPLTAFRALAQPPPRGAQLKLTGFGGPGDEGGDPVMGRTERTCVAGTYCAPSVLRAP